MIRWRQPAALIAGFALGIVLPGGCPLLGETGSDLGEVLGLSLFDDTDEADDVDADDIKDDSADTTPATVPNFSLAKFSNSTKIDNRYFPLVVGTTWEYSGPTEKGAEHILVEVLDQTRVVSGVTARVVRDRVTIDGVLVEDTHDFYAQDDAGNVWYLGEEVDDYNYDDAGNLIDITHDGAWETGKDVAGVGKIAQPGYNMLAAPTKNATYHQEWYPGEAEDLAEIVGVDVPITLSDGRSFLCLKTRDFSTLDSTINGFKYYAPGVGIVAEESPDGTERVELISPTQ